MAEVRRTILIRATPAAVFDLISRIEDFGRYTPVIKEIKAIGPDTYHWVVGLAGVELSWDAKVTEARPPCRLAWRSVSGLDNAGYFLLTPNGAGTRLQFIMEYRLTDSLLETIIEDLAAPIMAKIGDGILEQVRRRLESTPAA